MKTMGAKTVSLTEPRIDGAQIAVRMDLEKKYKLKKKFGKDNMSMSSIASAAIDFAVADVELDDADKEAIKADMKAAYEKRMEKRRQARRSPKIFTSIDYSKYGI